MNSLFRSIITAAAIAVGVTAMSGCDESSNPSGAAKPSKTAGIQPEDGLEGAIAKAVDAGKGYSVSDATDLDRDAHRSAPTWWKICFQKKGKAPSSVDFGVVLNSERCPDKWGDHVAVPETPNLVGQQFKDAEKKILGMGYPAPDMRVYYGGEAVTESFDLDSVRGQVCAQFPQAGDPFDNPENVKLHVAEGKCP